VGELVWLGLFWVAFGVHCSLFVDISLYLCSTYGHFAYFEIGFDWVRLALFSSSGRWWFSLVNLCGKGGCVGFVAMKIGFVLQKRG
jgi:hypothetical protein